MIRVGLFEAKQKLSELVARAVRGEEIVITRHGHPVAVLRGASQVADVERARQAGQRVEARRKRLGSISLKEIKSWIAEGRR